MRNKKVKNYVLRKRSGKKQGQERGGHNKRRIFLPWKEFEQYITSYWVHIECLEYLDSDRIADVYFTIDVDTIETTTEEVVVIH